MKAIHTREAYLIRAARIMNRVLLQAKAGVKLPENWHVSVTEPAKKRIGVAYPPTKKTHHVFVSASLQDGPRVLDVLLHEMIHIAIGVEMKHGPVFRRTALACGLTGKMTATVAGDELKEFCERLDEFLGGYPHKPLVKAAAAGRGKDSRVRLVSPEEEGYTLLISRKWLEQCGYPTDPWGNEMEEV
jgi:hypothetical protein